MNASGVSTAPKLESPLLAGLIRAELIDGLRQLQGIFARLEQLRGDSPIPATLGGQTAFRDATTMLGEMSERMALLAGLSETYAGHPGNGTERLFLYSLLSEVVRVSGGSAGARFVVREQQAEVAPIYGNKHWLTLLLRQLLRELDAGIHPGEKIVLTLRQLGSHMVLASSTEGMSAAERNSAGRPTLADTGLTVRACGRFVELHGGTLRLQRGDDGVSVCGMTLSLPTSIQGRPQGGQCVECPLAEQIECYAVDLAALLDRCEQLEMSRSTNAQVADRR